MHVVNPLIDAETGWLRSSLIGVDIFHCAKTSVVQCRVPESMCEVRLEPLKCPMCRGTRGHPEWPRSCVFLKK